MVERNLNKRDWSQNGTYQTFAQNYFPVTSAIAMRDKNGSNVQVTIMNDRAQGGSADLSDKSTIELMQNRRLTQDDGKGVADALNEGEDIADRYQGLQVTAKYMLQIFDFQKGKSKQRHQQILNDEPLQQLFSFNFTEPSDKNILNSLAELEQQVQVDFNTEGDTNDITYTATPLQKNQILVRFTNLADRFDKNSNDVKYLDVYKFA